MAKEKYNQAIKEVLDRYKKLGKDSGSFTKHYSKKELADFMHYLDQHLEIEEFHSTKYSRWLGFIQGVLVANGLITVEEERNLTRPLFKPLDTKNG